MRYLLPSLVLSLVLNGCSDPEAEPGETPPQTVADTPALGQAEVSDEADTRMPASWPLDDQLRLHHIQLRGTHNSYHSRPPLVVHPSHEYNHAPLAVQLEEFGVRVFELDLHLGEEGFEVYHLPLIDEVSSCKIFADCLSELREWSKGRPDHLPIIVWLELKDEFGGAAIEDIESVEAAIAAEIPLEQMLTPDDVRGGHESLRAALDAEGWPTLGEVRGRILFVILSQDERAEAYTAGFTSLKGQLLFARANSNQFQQPWAAIAKDGGADAVAAAHVGRLLVATNTCSADESDETCSADLATAIERGVHMLKDDVPAPVEGKSYSLDLAGGAVAACNPVTAPPECNPEALEGILSSE